MKLLKLIFLLLISNITFSQQTIVVSATNMNILYKGIENPITIAVSNYDSKDLIIKLNNGTFKCINKNKGEYVVSPSHTGEAVISVYLDNDFEYQAKKGSVVFRVKDIPMPIVTIAGKNGGSISKNELISSSLMVELKNFDFNGIRYKIINFQINVLGGDGKRRIESTTGNKLSPSMRKLINSSLRDTDIVFTDLTAIRVDNDKLLPRSFPPIVFTIK